MEALLAAVRIHSLTAFQLAGGPVVELAGTPPQAPAPAGPSPSPEQALVEHLVPLVYHQAYSRPYKEGAWPAPAATAQESTQAQPDPAFISQLSAANRGREHKDTGWRVYQLGQNGAVHVQKGDSWRLAHAGEYLLAGVPGRPPAVGDMVELRVLHESQVLQPGFYFVFGETVSSEFDDAHLCRLYFHARQVGVPALLQYLSEELNGYRVPFRLKCLTIPAGYERADSMVLYVARRFLGITLRLLAARAPALRELLYSGVPLFTKTLVPGLGAADEPGTGESFGQSRCRLVCRGLVEAWQKGQHSPQERLLAVAGQFSRRGLTLERPHLNEGMSDPYYWPATGRALA
ncbi:MAG: hypothetical protein JXB05_07405 [Myxococcaceae bacterium]|nr:hypothetical protein [Myxococcaceae bacterium]